MPEVRKKSRERAPSLFSVGELPPVDGELRIPKVEINTVVPRVQALDVRDRQGHHIWIERAGSGGAL